MLQHTTGTGPLSPPPPLSRPLSATRQVDAGLDLLLGLTCRHFGLLRSLAPLLAGLLDDVVALPLPQARKVYAAFAVMAFGVDGGAEAPARWQPLAGASDGCCHNPCHTQRTNAEKRTELEICASYGPTKAN